MEENNKAIGGYFELELYRGSEFHHDAIRLNTGRNALEYVLRAKSYKKIFIPYYTCDAILEPIKKLNMVYEFYSIDEDLEPIFNVEDIVSEEVFLYTNYFGLKDMYVQQISKRCKNLVIDNAQAFYSLPINGVDTFYSPRKFFGVPDGGYLYTNQQLKIDLEEDSSYGRCDHLLMRLEKNPEFGYPSFTKNEENLEHNTIKRMSSLTQKLLGSIDYDKAAAKRRENFNYLHKHLKNKNRLPVPYIDQQVPLVYPFWIKEEGLREKMVSQRIFVPQYWPNVKNWVPKESLEYRLAREIVFLPIDQRYGKRGMEMIINTLNV